MAETTNPMKPGELLKARLNQPRVSLEYLKEQENRHRRASEEFSKAARNGISKPGLGNTESGATA